MGDELAFENGRISDFRGLVALTLDRVILHTVIHHSSTSTYIPNFIKIVETFCGRTDGCTDGYLRPTSLGRLGGVDLKNKVKYEVLCNGAFLRPKQLRSATEWHVLTGSHSFYLPPTWPSWLYSVSIHQMAPPETRKPSLEVVLTTTT